MDKDVILTLIICTTQVGSLAWLSRSIHTGIKAVRRQLSAHNLFLSQLNMREAVQHERT